MLPKEIAKRVPKTHLMSETEWRNLGVQQSQGWVHYMIHQPGIFPSYKCGSFSKNWISSCCIAGLDISIMTQAHQCWIILDEKDFFKVSPCQHKPAFLCQKLNKSNYRLPQI